VKYVKNYEQITEGRLGRAIAGLGLAAASLSSCKKSDNVEITIHFGKRTAEVEALGQGSEWVGDQKCRLDKEDTARMSDYSPGWIFSERPTAEQLAIVACYRNWKRETDSNGPVQVGDRVFVWELADVETEEACMETGGTEAKITGSDFYKAAHRWCKGNPEIFQSDLDLLQKSSRRPSGIIGELANFDAGSILSDRRNRPSRY
jgi:hypothetical protein